MNVTFNRSDLSPAALAAPRLCYVGFHDACEREIYREDTNGDELQKLLAGGERIVITREFRASRRPVKWTVWPMSAGGKWLKTISGAVGG